MDKDIRRNIKNILLQYGEDIEGLLDFLDEMNILNPHIMCDGNMLYVPTREVYDIEAYQETFTPEKLKLDILEYSEQILSLSIENEDYEIAQKIKDYFKRIKHN
jgi:hydroxymethylpyrimidine pyrophosphatase-like HAD family hydrolase